MARQDQDCGPTPILEVRGLAKTYSHRRVVDGVDFEVYLAQESSIFRKLSVQDNLLGAMEMPGMDRKTRRQRCDELLQRFGLTQVRKTMGMSLSGGERRRVEFARALLTNPKIMLLDEPFIRTARTRSAKARTRPSTSERS